MAESGENYLSVYCTSTLFGQQDKNRFAEIHHAHVSARIFELNLSGPPSNITTALYVSPIPFSSHPIAHNTYVIVNKSLADLFFDFREHFVQRKQIE